MCEYCDLKKSEEYGGIYRGNIFIAKNVLCTSGLGLYLDEGNMANVVGLKHIDSVSVNFCFHCGKSAKEILKTIGKEAK